MQTYLQKNMCAFACFSIEMSKMEKKENSFPQSFMIAAYRSLINQTFYALPYSNESTPFGQSCF
jgi:hypothetical protein